MAAEITLIDTNIFIRFLTADDPEGDERSAALFQRIEEGEIRGMVPDFIVAEVVYVLRRIYKVPRREITNALKRLLTLEHLDTDNKIVTFEALEIYGERNIDFADALLCARSELYGYGIASLDRDLKRCGGR